MRFSSRRRSRSRWRSPRRRRRQRLDQGVRRRDDLRRHRQSADPQRGHASCRNQRVVAVGPASAVAIPPGAQRIDLSTRTIVPGFINTHGHVGSAQGLESGPEVNTPGERGAATGAVRALRRHDGGEPRRRSGGGFAARDAQAVPSLDRARLFVAGRAIVAQDAGGGAQMVDTVAALRPDMDQDSRRRQPRDDSQKMAPEVYRAVIDQAHRRKLRVAAHMFYLDDAQGAAAGWGRHDRAQRPRRGRSTTSSSG